MPGHKSKTELQTERSIGLLQTTTNSTGMALVQANLQASKTNSRLYRQCRSYNVGFRLANLDDFNVTSYSTVDFYTLPNTWFVHGAIKHAFETYMQAMSDELQQGIKMARWHDFSINEQDPDGTWDYLSAALYDGGAWSTVSSDETITDSSVTDSGGTAKGFNLFGTISNSYNIFTEFANKLKYGYPTDESTSSSQPYDGLLDLDDADVLAERGDKAPYDRDYSTFLPDAGGDDQTLLVWRDSLVLDVDGGSTKTVTRKFDAPLGLVFVRTEIGGSDANLGSSVPSLSLEFTPGDYKGVKSHSLV